MAFIRRLIKKLPGLRRVFEERDRLRSRVDVLERDNGGLHTQVEQLASARGTIDRFHELYYDSKVWGQTRWRGVRALKCPLDLWIYQELIDELKPDLIVETGTQFGGSAFYLASICDLADHGHIITIDIAERPNRPVHPRVTYVNGSSVAPEVVDRVRDRAKNADVVLVILDSDHTCDHVLAELRAYQDVVTPGSYLIVEDTNINGHPVYPSYGPGPMEALERFIEESGDAFEPDPDREKFFLTFNPRGFLRKR